MGLFLNLFWAGPFRHPNVFHNLAGLFLGEFFDALGGDFRTCKDEEFEPYQSSELL